jgi:hypothetical protein
MFLKTVLSLKQPAVGCTVPKGYGLPGLFLNDGRSVATTVWFHFSVRHTPECSNDDMIRQNVERVYLQSILKHLFKRGGAEQTLRSACRGNE